MLYLVSNGLPRDTGKYHGQLDMPLTALLRNNVITNHKLPKIADIYSSSQKLSQETAKLFGFSHWEIDERFNPSLIYHDNIDDYVVAAQNIIEISDYEQSIENAIREIIEKGGKSILFVDKKIIVKIIQILRNQKHLLLDIDYLDIVTCDLVNNTIHVSKTMVNVE